MKEDPKQQEPASPKQRGLARQRKFFMYELALCFAAACLLAGYFVAAQSNPYASCNRVIITNQKTVNGTNLYPNNTSPGWYCNTFASPAIYHLCANKFANCTNQTINATGLKTLLQEELRVANESYNATSANLPFITTP